MRELAGTVMRLTGSRSPIVTAQLPQDDPVRRNPDITRARELLAWEPQVNLDQGLIRTIDYFRPLVARST